MKSNKLIAITLSLILITGLAACSAGTPASAPSPPSAQQSHANADASAQPDTSANPLTAALPLSADLTAKDTNSSYDESTSTKITLNGASAIVDGMGASVDGGVMTITAAGIYIVSGKLTDGQIVIAAGENDNVQLVLNGAEITNKTGAAIYAKSCDKLIVTLADHTSNILTDGGDSFQYADTANEEPNAALFADADLSINGEGSLTVNAGFNNGIGTKDDLVIVRGTITVDAKNHGIRGRDSVTVTGGSIAVVSGGDAIQSNNDKDALKGYVIIEGGSFALRSETDGIQAETALQISGGTFDIVAGGGAENASTADNAESHKGIKAGTDITVTGGSFSIDSADDGVHANGNVNIGGGEFAIKTGDDGVHADENLDVSGGTITVSQSYEGLEAANITISDGIINLVCTDDAINAAGGADGATPGSRFGQDRFSASGNHSLDISGGNITFTAGGDGLDSNGAINISGGTTVALISSSPDNGAIDCDGTYTLTGGTVIYGGTGIGSISGGNYIYVENAGAGKEISVRKDGETLIAFTPAIDCKYLVLTSPDIVSGQAYEVYSAGDLLSSATAGTGGNTGMGFRGGGPSGQGGRVKR